MRRLISTLVLSKYIYWQLPAYYMVNNSVSLAVFDFTINYTEKCTTAYASLLSIHSSRAGLKQTESHFSSRVFSRLVKVTRAMRMKSVFCQLSATQTRLKTDFATQTKPATHILFILLWHVCLHKSNKSDKNDM